MMPPPKKDHTALEQIVRDAETLGLSTEAERKRNEESDRRRAAVEERRVQRPTLVKREAVASSALAAINREFSKAEATLNLVWFKRSEAQVVHAAACTAVTYFDGRVDSDLEAEVPSIVPIARWRLSLLAAALPKAQIFTSYQGESNPWTGEKPQIRESNKRLYLNVVDAISGAKQEIDAAVRNGHVTCKQLADLCGKALADVEAKIRENLPHFANETAFIMKANEGDFRY